MARAYGTERFGQWSIAVVYGTLIAAIVEGGLGKILLREAARFPEHVDRHLGLVLKGRIFLTAVALPAALATAWAFVESRSTWVLVALLVVIRALEGLQSSYFSVMYAFDRFSLPNQIEMGRRVLLLTGVALVVFAGGGLVSVALVYLAIVVASTWPIVSGARPLARPSFAGSLRGYRLEAVWFWLGGVLFWINGEVDQLMLSSLRGEEAVGVYAAAVRLVTFFFVIPVAVNNTVIPRLFRSAKSGRNLELHLNGTAFFLSALGSLLAVEFFFSGRDVVGLVFGGGYEETQSVMVVFAVFIFFHFVRIAPSWYLAASDRVGLNTLFLAGAAVANVLLNLWLIPRWGPAGAAWATGASAAILFLAAVGAAVSYTGSKLFWAILLGTAAAFPAMAIHLIAPQSWPWFIPSFLIALATGVTGAWVAQRMMRGWSPFGLFTA